MKQRNIIFYKNIGYAFLGISVLMVLLVTFISSIHQDMTSADRLIFWTVKHHLTITIVLMILSVFLGYLLSIFTYNQLKKSKKESKNLLNTVLLFLNDEEKKILDFLVENKGTTTQSEISKLARMNRVKAFRSLKQMKEKNLIEIVPHGKIRKIKLRENILNTLSEEG